MPASTRPASGLGPPPLPSHPSASEASPVKQASIAAVPQHRTASRTQRSHRILAASLVVVLALLACTPHWLGPILAVTVSLIGIPITLGARRVTEGQNRRLTITVAACLAAVLVVAIVAPTLWWQAGVLRLPTISELP